MYCDLRFAVVLSTEKARSSAKGTAVRRVLPANILDVCPGWLAGSGRVSCRRWLRSGVSDSEFGAALFNWRDQSYARTCAHIHPRTRRTGTSPPTLKIVPNVIPCQWAAAGPLQKAAPRF